MLYEYFRQKRQRGIWNSKRSWSESIVLRGLAVEYFPTLSCLLALSTIGGTDTHSDERHFQHIIIHNSFIIPKGVGKAPGCFF